MINKYTNKQRGLLAVIMAMVMVFAGAAFVAAEVDADPETAVTNDAIEDSESFASALSDAKENDVIVISKNINYKGILNCNVPITIKGSSKDVELVVESVSGYDHDITSTISFENITLKTKDSGPLCIKNINGLEEMKVTFTNVNVSNANDFFIYNNTTNGTDKTKVTITGSDFTGSKINAQFDGRTVLEISESTIPDLVVTGSAGSAVTVGTELIIDDTSVTNLYPVVNVTIPNTKTLTAVNLGLFSYTDKGQEVVCNPGMIIVNKGGALKYTTIAQTIVVIDNNSDVPFEADSLDEVDNAFETGADSVEYTGEEIDRDYVVPANKEFVIGSEVQVTDGITITISSGATLNMDGVNIDDGITVNVDGVNVEVGEGVFSGELTWGSVSWKIKADNTSSLTVPTGKDLEISGTVGNSFTVEADTVAVVDTLTIDAGATLTVESGDKTLTVYDDDNTKSSSLYIYGGLTSDDLTVEVGDGSTFKAFGGATIPETVTVTGTEKAKIDLADAMSTMTINDDVASSNIYSQMQTVVIADTLTLKNTTVTTILGKFVVNEGVTLTIEEGAKLIIDSTTADMVVNGEIIVEEGAELIVENAKDVAISGQISSEGIISIDSTVTIKEGGSIVVENEDSSKIFVKKGLTIEKGGELDIRAIMDINGITNKGTVTLDGAILSNNSEITMAADGAKVEVKSFIGNYKLTITDEGVILGKDENKNDVIVSESDPTPTLKNYNRIVTQGGNNIGLGGFTTTYSVTSIKDDGKIKYSNEFIIAGTVAIIDETNDDKDKSATVYVGTYGGSKVIDSLTIGKGIDMVVSYGKISIDGTVTAVASDSSINMSGGMMTVEGLVQTISKISENINAAKYQDDVNGVTNYYYTSFSKAVASGDDEIEILGNIKVLEDVIVPAGIKVKNNGTMEVGDSKNRDVTVTFADGSELRNGKVTVNGTVVFDNKKNEKSVSITSDVVVTGEISKMYTNLYTALANAKPGDVVTVNGDDIKIDADLTIPEGVTLDIISGKTMTINDDVTLTVDGTLRTASAVLAQTTFADEASENESCIIVNGTFMSMDDIEFTNYNIPGAYYNIVDASGNYDYVTPVEAVETVAQKVTNGVIDIYGENKVSDVTLAGTEDLGLEITIQTGADVDLSTMTLAYATLTITGTVNGTVGSDAGSIEFVDVKSAVVTVDADADGTVMNIAGTLADGGDSNVKSKVTIASGTVTVAAALDVKNMEKHISISAGAELSVIKSGTFEAKQVTIDGELYVTDSGSVKITEKMTVLGTFEVAEADTEANTAAGNATIATMYVGMTSKQVTGEGATIIGKPTIEKLMYVDASATIPADLIKDKKFVEFYVEDALWMTVYDFSAIGNVEVKEIPVENVKLVTWTDKDGKRVTTSATNAAENYTVKIEDNKVYAKINYNVYLVKIWAAEGIDDVYIDGILVPGSALIGEYATQYVSAGTHTISYTLANGYTGSAQMVINDKLVSGYTFNAEGDYDDVEYIIKLQGIEKAPAEVGGGDAPVADKDEGMDLTDILLIVLVVLIVIMAIIVALRMMRS